ncbi:MAG: two-component regulator propeller domain-containing protein [Lacibacter sp.]
MITKKLILSFFLTVPYLFASFAQTNISFTSLSTKDGLSSNTVNAILKDRYGIMWFATEDGLNKFDGTNFTVYRTRPNDKNSLQANDIVALHEDRDGRLWVGTSGGSLSMYNRTYDNFVNYPSFQGANSIDHNVILSFCSDPSGKIWVGHYGGVNILDPKTKKIERLNLPGGQRFTKAVTALFRDSKNQIWIGSLNGLYLYSSSQTLLHEFLNTQNDKSSLSGNDVRAIIEDKQKKIWIGTSNGLSLLQSNGTFLNYRHDEFNNNSLTSSEINSLAVDFDNKLWVGTGNGLNILDSHTGKNLQMKFDTHDDHSLTVKTIKSLLIDKDGIYWIGSYRGGIIKYDKNLNFFNLVKSNPFDQKGLLAPIVTSFAEAPNGNVFVGTDGGGLSLFNPATKTFQQIKLSTKLPADKRKLVVLALEAIDKNELLAATYLDGLFIINPETSNYQQLTSGNGPDDLNSNEIFCIEKDRYGNKWIGTNGKGINVLNKENKVIIRYTPSPTQANDKILPGNAYIRAILEDKKGNIWIATHGGGLVMLQPQTGKFTIYMMGDSKLPNDKVLSILEDHKGNLWVGTLGAGLGLFNKQTNQFSVISEQEGLLNNTIYKILEDQKGILWLSTNRGLSSYDPSTKLFANYTYHNGVQHNNFINGSGLKTSNGYLFFGGLDGFNYFNPEQLKKNIIAPPVLITELRISNKPVLPSENGPIKENISSAKRIDLKYRQNFALSFVGLNYTTPEQNNYAYKLEGFDKDWNYIGAANSASYTNLDPGVYTFHVKASANNGVWNTKEGTTIKIIVHPPFWRTIYAYFLYAFVIAGLFIYLRHRSIQKIQRKYIQKQEQFRAEQERKDAERIHELDQLKIKFLTNLSHEFRTPISLILGPVETILAEQKENAFSSQLNMIKRNGRRLLNLVNQLLDFRKMEEQELKLQTENGELISFIHEVYESFQDLSERKKINFTFSTAVTSFYTQFDHDKIERILFNLLSNAFKFTPEDGSINLDIQKQSPSSDSNVTWITLKVKDNGIGIPFDKKEIIFERFIQNTTNPSILNRGTGIGLSITKEFVKMHGGTIELESELGKGSTFTLLLPFTESTLNQNSTVHSAESTPNETSGNKEENVSEKNQHTGTVQNKNLLPLILLVEDNDDFRFYLKENLRTQYNVIEATNGLEGWQKTLSAHPKLIVSDIGMPEMDGIEFCRKIKNDKRTSHTPVILLTAFTGEKEQIKGLETGANDYITKPFNFEILSAKIKNLLVLNNTLQNTYSKRLEIVGTDVEVESSSNKLLQKIALYIEDNLNDTQLSVEALSRHVGMSRSTLYSKLLELTGQTPVEFIRSVKLNKAAQLLEKSDMTIAEIAYTVGFATPNYFAKSFKAKFNILPSAYMNKKRKEKKENDDQ